MTLPLGGRDSCLIFFSSMAGFKLLACLVCWFVQITLTPTDGGGWGGIDDYFLLNFVHVNNVRFGIIFQNYYFGNFSSGIMLWCNLNHLLSKEGLRFRELYLVEFRRNSRGS